MVTAGHWGQISDAPQRRALRCRSRSSSLQLQPRRGASVQAVTNVSGIRGVPDGGVACHLDRGKPGMGLYTWEHRLERGLLSWALPETGDLCRNRGHWPCGWRSRCAAFTGGRCMWPSAYCIPPCLQVPLKALWWFCWFLLLLFLISASFLAFVTSPSLLGVGTKWSSRHHLPARPVQETSGVPRSCGSCCTRPRTEASAVHTAPSSLWVQRRRGVHSVTPAEEPALLCPRG